MTAGESLRVFPNPAREFLQITGPLIHEQSVKIRNLFGQVIYLGQVADGKINLTGQSPGLYSLEVEQHAPIKIIIAGNR
jgi:hypothetical protein